MQVIVVVIVFMVLAVGFAVWLLPAWLPFLASFLVKPRTWCEIKWSLRVASLASLAIAVVAWRAHQSLLGPSDFFAPDLHAIATTVAWTWAGGFASSVAALIAGAALHAIRRKRSGLGSGEP
jgi:hypothetical protein